MVLTEQNHRARLRSFGALGMLRDKPHLVANLKLVEGVIDDAVAMEIDLLAISADDEAAILLAQEASDAPVVGHHVQLYVTAPLANVIFEHTAGSVETVAYRDVDILMRMVRLGIALDDDLSAGNRKVDPDPEKIALLVARVLAFDDDAARSNPIEKAFELLGALAYSRPDGIRGVRVAKADLKWNLHRNFPLSSS